MKAGSRTKYTILGMLSINSMSGYEIAKNIKNSTNHFWSESEGQLYPALSVCVKEKLATCKEENSQKSKRIKKIYTITPKGTKELQAWLKKESQTTLVRNELLLKLFFGNNVSTTDNVHHIRHQQKSLEQEINLYGNLRQEIIKKGTHSGHHKYWLITLDYGLKSAKAELTWCKESIKLLEST